MQNQTSPLILTFGATDPVGAAGIQADLATFAAMGCYGLSIITTILIGDTIRIKDSQIIDVDWVNEQARIILEDMPISAFKVGAVGSIAHISVIAEIVSDYPDILLILDPFISNMPALQGEEDDYLIAMRELLIPQTTLMLVSAMEMGRLAETWREPILHDMYQSDAARIIEMGCEYLLVTRLPSSASEIVNILFDETGIIRRDSWRRLPGSFIGAGSTLSAAICAMLANGLKISEAVCEAQEFTLTALARSQRLGMGKLVPDRYFWARESSKSS